MTLLEILAERAIEGVLQELEMLFQDYKAGKLFSQPPPSPTITAAPSEGDKNA